MAGYSPTTTAGTAPITRNVPMYQDLSGFDDDEYGRTAGKRLIGQRTETIPGTKDVTTWSKAGEGVDPTGGAKEYFQKLQDFSTNFEFNPEDGSFLQVGAYS